MDKIIVDNEITLVKYYPNYKISLEWYQDYDVCKQVDNRDELYDLDLLKAMYSYLNRNGHLYYIKYKNRLCGDICLQNDGYLAIVICKKYQNKHIGRRAVNALLDLARNLGYKEVYAEIYSFNIQSRQMFKSLGFFEKENELFKKEL